MTSIFQYQFAVDAVLSMFFLSIVAGIIGSYIVVRRMVFVAGGITHASFGGIGIAYYLGASPVGGAIIFSVLTALGIEALSQRGKVREDSAIAMLWSLGMAVGVLFMFMTPGYTPNLMGFMFGDVLAVSQTDVWSVGIMAIVTIIGAIIFYRPIMYIAFSPSFAQLTGWKVKTISSLMAVIVAIALVLAIKSVGIILVLSIFSIPQSIANIFTKNFAWMMVVSSLIALLSGMAGLMAAFFFDLPVGAVITALLTITFLLVRWGANINNKYHKL